jgi:hypothetical protein
MRDYLIYLFCKWVIYLTLFAFFGLIILLWVAAITNNLHLIENKAKQLLK